MQTIPAVHDLGSPDVIADPYPVYRALRDISPVRYVRVPAGLVPGIEEPIHAWALLRHADVFAALRDTETFSSNVTSAIRVLPRLTLLHDDPPRHLHLRRLVNRAFSPKRVTDLEPWIRSIATSLLDALGEGPTELMRDYAIPLPMQVIATLLGIPPEEYATFRSWSEATIGYSGGPLADRSKRMQEMTTYLGKAILARKEAPVGDLISALAEAEIDGASLEAPEIIGLCVLILVAGNETTTNLIGNMLHLLAQRPALWQQARGDRGLVDRIIDETLRFASPVQRLLRQIRRPVEVAGVALAEGELVDIMYGAANRDPAVFEEPDVFRTDRSTSEHLGFGNGIHYCLGAPLARAEASITLNAWLDRFEAIEPGSAPAVRQRHALMPYGFASLPLVPRRG